MSADPSQSSGGWWGMMDSAWKSIQETAQDFKESITSENEDTIRTLKDTIQPEQLSKNVSERMTSMNKFLNDAITTISTEDPEGDFQRAQDQQQIESTIGTFQPTQESGANNTYVEPKPFEKERATYASDPYQSKSQSSKFDKFCRDIGKDTSDNELCLNGRALLQGNRAISTYFQTLVPHEVDEITFWKRYFYWKLQAQTREKMINRHASRDNTPETDRTSKDKPPSTPPTVDKMIAKQSPKAVPVVTKQVETSAQVANEETQEVPHTEEKTEVKEAHDIAPDTQYGNNVTSEESVMEVRTVELNAKEEVSSSEQIVNVNTTSSTTTTESDNSALTAAGKKGLEATESSEERQLSSTAPLSETDWTNVSQNQKKEDISSDAIAEETEATTSDMELGDANGDDDSWADWT